MQKGTKYKCPDCGWTYTSGSNTGGFAHEPSDGLPSKDGFMYRCGGCGSLNVERQLAEGSWWKADRADPKICRDCQTLYETPLCPKCGGDELWDPNTDDPDWFKNALKEP